MNSWAPQSRKDEYAQADWEKSHRTSLTACRRSLRIVPLAHGKSWLHGLVDRIQRHAGSVQDCRSAPSQQYSNSRRTVTIIVAEHRVAAKEHSCDEDSLLSLLHTIPREEANKRSRCDRRGD